MYKLRKTKRIEASHQLPNHDGKCRNLHGHTWTITVEVRGTELQHGGPKDGMLVDYADLSDMMKYHVEVLDHRHLNDVLENPTSENLAYKLYCDILAFVKEKSCRCTLSRVIVSETQDSQAEYCGGS